MAARFARVIKEIHEMSAKYNFHILRSKCAQVSHLWGENDEITKFVMF